MLHDSNKRLIKVSDIYPDYADLKKGDYVIRLQLRHDDAVLLDKMKDLPVVVERKLKEAVSVPVYATNRDAVKGSKPVKERALHPGRFDTIDKAAQNASSAVSIKQTQTTAVLHCPISRPSLFCVQLPCLAACPALPCPACPALPCPALLCPALRQLYCSLPCCATPC